MIIVSFAGGLAGDLVSAVIDSTDCFLLPNGKVNMFTYRKKLKQGATLTEEYKDEFVSTVSTIYQSIPSHDWEYHLQKKHTTLSIDVKDPELYKFAAKRFISLNQPGLVNKLFGINSIEEFVPILTDITKKHIAISSHVIYFDDIINGKLIEKLELITSTELNTEFYNEWLKLQINR